MTWNTAQIQEKAESCPSCRAAGKNIISQIPSTEKNHLEILTEPNQEIQLDFTGPIKSKTRGDVYILVNIDRFSKWPTAQICKKHRHTDRPETFNKIFYGQ